MNDSRHEPGPDRAAIDTLRATLDREADAVRTRHADRLAEARAAALAARPARHPARWSVLLPIAASIAVVALTAALLIERPGATEPMPRFDDLDLLASEAFDVASDELEFYAWLAEQELEEAGESSG